MPLFQNTVVTKYLQSQDKVEIESKWELFKAYFHNLEIQENIRNSKEEQFQEGFLRELFVKILGYTLNPQPNFNLTTELKNVKDSKKADGGILVKDRVIGVIELKGTNTTDLGKVEDQAFGYKNNQAGCIYVITSNFEKLRFYIDNAIEHIEFNLFTISEQDFKLLYLCLGYENIKNNIPKKLKEESLSQEELITKQLYKDYSLFKRELFQNLCVLNPQFEPLELFKKSQKLLDRFLFLFFAEDRNLLPPNSVRVILKQWKQLKELDAYTPLYDRFKKYFGYLNTGFKGKQYNVFPYNGGLFKPDEVLDTIQIDDDLLYKHSYQLSEYDFESEVDVNILGHIFENSLNELDEITAQLEGKTINKADTKRKKDGVFYTPKYITKYIVENTIGKLCEEKKVELDITDEAYQPAKQRSRKRLDNLSLYKDWLLQLTICDPACGSGAFLNQALDFLINEHRYIDELSAKYNKDAFVLSDVENSILENNLFGVDLNEESVQIAKLSLWLRTAQPNRKLNDLSDNIKCGNSLIDDVSVAGDSAFPQIFAKGGFDVIIGNPPYVNSKEEMFSNDVKNFFNSNYKTSAYQIDLYILFLEKSIKLICKNGTSSLIVPNSWLNNIFLDEVRKFFLTSVNIDEIVSMPSKTFMDANVDTVIVTFSKIKIDESTQLTICNDGQFEIIGTQKQSEWLAEIGYIINVHLTKEIKNIFKKVLKDSVTLESLADIGRGVGVYHKRVGHTKDFIAEDPYQSSEKKDNTFLPYLRGRNVQSGYINWNSDSYISYGNWLAEPREPKFFKGDRIVLRQIPSKRLIVSYIEEDFVIDQSVFIARFYENSKFSAKAIASILGSRLLSFYFRFYYSEFDDLFPKVKLQHFKLFPITTKLANSHTELEDKSECFLKFNKELLDISQKFQRNLKREFEQLDKPSKKLENWYELTYADFLKELKKKKVELSLSQKAEWEDYFLGEQQKANALKTQINQTDAEIDKMVYELYGLTDEEIKIVEDA